MSKVYYGVEPYTGKIICHDGLGKASPFRFRLTEEERKKIINDREREEEFRKRKTERREFYENMKNKIGSAIGRISKKWGFTNGVPNGKRKAKGKIDPNTGQYFYEDKIYEKKLPNRFIYEDKIYETKIPNKKIR